MTVTLEVILGNTVILGASVRFMGVQVNSLNFIA